MHPDSTGDTPGVAALDGERLYHLALPADWDEALGAGQYETSTRGASLAEVGFVHLSFEHQWPQTRTAFYADVHGELLLLEIDPARLTDPVVVEVGNLRTGERFPHLYGPLPVSAVLRITRLAPPHHG